MVATFGRHLFKPQNWSNRKTRKKGMNWRLGKLRVHSYLWGDVDNLKAEHGWGCGAECWRSDVTHLSEKQDGLVQFVFLQVMTRFDIDAVCSSRRGFSWRCFRGAVTLKALKGASWLSRWMGSISSSVLNVFFFVFFAFQLASDMRFYWTREYFSHFSLRNAKFRHLLAGAASPFAFTGSYVGSAFCFRSF